MNWLVLEETVWIICAVRNILIQYMLSFEEMERITSPLIKNGFMLGNPSEMMYVRFVINNIFVDG